jgi:hypothetical protein
MRCFGQKFNVESVKEMDNAIKKITSLMNKAQANAARCHHENPKVHFYGIMVEGFDKAIEYMEKIKYEFAYDEGVYDEDEEGSK